MSAVLDELKRPHRWSVSEYHRMGEAGFFAPDARVELIEGEVFDMAPIGSKHFSAVNRLNHVLVSAVGGQAIVSIQNPVVLSDQKTEILRAPGAANPLALPNVKVDLTHLLD
jgi:Putative restriction endonuclease